jgi:hypothetical protein
MNLDITIRRGQRVRLLSPKREEVRECGETYVPINFRIFSLYQINKINDANVAQE